MAGIIGEKWGIVKVAKDKPLVFLFFMGRIS
jgi:hypothetical protein